MGTCSIPTYRASAHDDTMVNGDGMRIAIAGASGFVGRALISELVAQDYEVIALSRHPLAIPGVKEYAVDVADEQSLDQVLAGCDIAFYLVHSLAERNFRIRDRQLAQGFGQVAAAVGISRIVFLGGLGQDPASEHLASRQEVGTALSLGGVPVVELRAAIVLGAGSISFEMLRYLTERLPFMVCPQWVHTAIQPIASSDVVRYLIGAMSVEPGVYEIGGPKASSYREMIDAYAAVRGLRRRRILDVPFLTPRLSSYWLDFVTPVDSRVSHTLVESLITEVVVQNRHRTDEAFGIESMDLVNALTEALDDQTRSLDEGVLDREAGLQDGIYTMRMTLPVHAQGVAEVDTDFDQIGGDYRWYGVALLWQIRAMLGHIVGERLRLHKPTAVVPGAAVDWWVVARREPDVLVLRSNAWFPGEGWLGYEVDGDQLVQVGAFRSKGIPGFLYWKFLQPIHWVVFRVMARHRANSSSGSRA